MLLIYTAAGVVQQSVEEPADEGYAERCAAFGLLVARAPDDWLGARTLADVWVDPGTGEAAFRPIYPAAIDRTEIRADGTDAAYITGLPMPTTLVVDGVAHPVEDGTLELTSAMAAEYRIAADHWPYLPWETVVRAA